MHACAPMDANINIYTSKCLFRTIMTFGEDYLKLVGNIGNFSKEVTGVSLIDAYFGPENLSPTKAKQHSTPEKLLNNIYTSKGETKEIDDELRRIAITSSLESLEVVVRWLSGEEIPYTRLVEGIFGITPSKFGEKEIRKAQQKVEDASINLPGSDVSQRIQKWIKENEISGEALKKTVDTEIVDRTREIERLFEKQIFAYFPTKIENKGIVYKTVTAEPWTAYNYYQGNYTSINAFNIDMPFNKYGLIEAVSHEYEHHVANLFREKCYREKGLLDLSAVLLHTKSCIISEGTADCAKDFLGLQLSGEYNELIEALHDLERVITINVTYMFNVENSDDKTAAEYFTTQGFMPIEKVEKYLGILKPMRSDGKPNFFSPYIYNYIFGKRDYVLPTFQKAQEKNRLKEFFRTLYLNPYSRSTATWKIAFSKI